MNQETLKKLRLLIPGIITILIGYYYQSLLLAKPMKTVEFKDFSYPLIAAICIGVYFYLSNIRFLVTNYSHKKIDLNIKNHIISLYTGRLLDDDKQYLYQKNRLKDIFYNIVDNDESLKNKSKNVYFNGLIWTSTADLFIISLFSSLTFIVSAFIFSNVKSELLFGGLFLILVAMISLGLHVVAFFKHINLSNEQISYIETSQINRVDELINIALKQKNGAN